MKKIAQADCIYVAGDSWSHGSELIDPESSIQNHFHPVHENYRLAHRWPRLLADQLGVELISGTYPGASNDYIVRNTCYDLAKLVQAGRRPFAVIAWTQLHRFELPKGPGGYFYEQFVGPTQTNLESVGTTIFKAWSSDRTDVLRWCQQIILLDAFIKTLGIDYISTTVFRQIYSLYENYTTIERDHFFPLVTQIRQQVNLNRHFLHVSMETYLKQQISVAYGPGEHPLAQGHRLLAEQFLAQITSKFQFQRLGDQTSTT